MESFNLEQVLLRKDVRRGQITLLKELYERRDESVSYDELADRIRGDDRIQANAPESLRGVLRAFGRRINGTDEIPDKPGIEAFVKKERRDGELHYQLRPEAREAIECDEELMEKIDQPMDKLLDKGTRIER